MSEIITAECRAAPSGFVVAVTPAGPRIATVKFLGRHGLVTGGASMRRWAAIVAGRDRRHRGASVLRVGQEISIWSGCAVIPVAVACRPAQFRN